MIKTFSTRLAVNLCLIGAILLPHVVLSSSYANSCQSSASKSSDASNCRCASLGRRKLSGCCCRQRAKLSAAVSCSQPPTRACCAKRKTQIKPKQAQPSAPVVTCLCSRNIPPATPNSGNRVDLQQQSKQLCNSITSIFKFCASDHSNFYHTISVAFLTSTESQQHLCKWQL